ncbi:MAG: hypothetical protein QOJ71_3101 [Actinomycetota bacterium]|jgi:hypothetical protein|nr:hypothetical protein [Actinomycetota bacterium]
MRFATKRRVASFLLVLPLTLVGVLTEQPAGAAPFVPFAYKLNATTHLKKLNQTVTVPPGTFVGQIDLGTSHLTGAITLPPATIRLKLAGIVPLVTATVKIIPTKAVTGTVDLTKNPFPVVATATFNIQVVSAYAGILPINLVGNRCTTSTPVAVTMRGTASLGAPATFSGPYTIPPLKNCGLTTAALNLVIPGPGNTFTAVATPQ